MRTTTRSDWRDYAGLCGRLLLCVGYGVGVVWVVLCLIAALGCAPPQPPVVVPQDPPAPLVRTVSAAFAGPTTPTVTLSVDTQPPMPPVGCVFNRPQHTICILRPDIPIPFGATLRLEADGYHSVETFVEMLPERFGASGNLEVETALEMQPIVPPFSRLRMTGRSGFVDETGRSVPATSATAFQLVEFMAHGREAEAARFLESIRPARFVRVLVMAAHLFVLSPSEGLAALPALLDLGAAKGVYVEVTALADTTSFPGLDDRVYLAGIGAICAAKPACGAIEIGNELHSLHPTQDARLGDVAYLRELRALIPAHIPVSLGSTHAHDDESDIFRDGDYLTIHGDRSEEGDGVWRPLRHTNEQRALADRLGTFAWNDEPTRSIFACDWQVGMGLLTRLFSLGDTFHSRSGLFALPFDAAERAALDCRGRGWAAIPDDWVGQYFNAGFVGSPVKSFDGAVRVYSSVRGTQGYTLVIGAQPHLWIDWADGWSRTRVLAEGAVQLWQVSR